MTRTVVASLVASVIVLVTGGVDTMRPTSTDDNALVTWAIVWDAFHPHDGVRD